MAWVSSIFARLALVKSKSVKLASDDPIPSRTLDSSYPPSRCLISTVPIEIIFCIADYLPHGNQLATSHTCKALYYNIKSFREKRKDTMTLIDHRLYIWLLCKSSIDRYACLDCNDIHTLDVTNSPTNRRSICPKEYSKRTYGSSLAGLFQVDYGHVQLACKLSQVPYETLPPHHQTFLDRLLLRYDLTTRAPRSWMRPKTTYSETGFRAQLYIVERKCVLERSWWLDFKGSYTGEMDSIIGSIQICPHENTSLQRAISDPLDQYQQPNLRIAGRGALMKADENFKFFCNMCATDYAVMHRTNGIFTLVVWQTLGGSDFESHRFWEEHSWRDGVPGRPDQPSGPNRTELESLRLMRKCVLR